MKIICGWCKRILEEGSEPASHSICSDCAKNFLEELGQYNERTALYFRESEGRMSGASSEPRPPVHRGPR